VAAAVRVPFIRPASALPLRIKMYHARQCDPKKCTGKRMIVAGQAEEAQKVQALRHSLFLDPFARAPLLGEDRAIVDRLGLGVLDCSWQHAGEEHEGRRFPNCRRLPMLVATNTVNYGKAGLLSTAEAIASALHILGEPAAARVVLSRFKWGPHFLELNADLLDAYAGAADVARVDSIERGTFGQGANLELRPA
jgi:pre-rRNA-processing protein TSR3